MEKKEEKTQDELIEEEVGEETKLVFNLSQTKIDLISNLMNKAMEYNLIGELHNGFYCWTQIALLVSNRLTPEEQKLLRVKEILVKKNSMKKKPGLKLLDKPTYEFDKNSFIHYSNKYVMYLNKLLRSTGMDMKETSDDSDMV